MTLGPVLRTSTIHNAFTVYKDYDGNCPDGPVVAICAEAWIAEELVLIFNRRDPNSKDDSENDYETTSREEVVNWDEFPWPFSEGWEWSARWAIKNVEAESCKIAETVEDALKQVAALA